jgi:hypothetical protein
MGLAHSPRIITDGLIFALDSGNDKSYKGPAIQNITNQITQIGTGTANGYSFTASTENVFVPTLGYLTAKVNSGYNNYSAVSTNCCPALFAYGWLAVSPSTLYTYGILYKTTSGYTHPNFMYRYEYTSGSVYVTEAGVHSDSNRIHLGDGWYWAWGTFTTQATTAFLQTYSFYYRYTTAVDNMYVAKTLIVPGNYSGLHPRYWPELNATRANTATHSDMIGLNTSIAANSLTYGSDGSYTFNGSSNVIRVYKNLLSGTSDFTITAVARTTNMSSVDYICGNYGVGNNGLELYFQNSIVVLYAVSTYLTGITTLSSNTWYHITAVRSSGVATLYVNGKFEVSGTMTGNIPTSNPFTIGNGHDYTSEAFSGNIPYVKVYNKALSAAEVQQNFNALRGRFGI